MTTTTTRIDHSKSSSHPTPDLLSPGKSEGKLSNGLPVSTDPSSPSLSSSALTQAPSIIEQSRKPSDARITMPSVIVRIENEQLGKKRKERDQEKPSQANGSAKPQAGTSKEPVAKKARIITPERSKEKKNGESPSATRYQDKMEKQRARCAELAEALMSETRDLVGDYQDEVLKYRKEARIAHLKLEELKASVEKKEKALAKLVDTQKSVKQQEAQSSEREDRLEKEQQALREREKAHTKSSDAFLRQQREFEKTKEQLELQKKGILEANEKNEQRRIGLDARTLELDSREKKIAQRETEEAAKMKLEKEKLLEMETALAARENEVKNKEDKIQNLFEQIKKLGS